MIRTTDVSEVNRLLRREWPEAEYEEVLSDPLNVCLLEGENGAIFAWRGPGIYELHVFFEVRGRAAIDLARAFINHARREFGGKMFWTLIPVESRHVIMFARKVGMRSRGVLETRLGYCELFDLETV